MDEEQILAAPPLDLVDFAAQRPRMVDRLGERVGRTLLPSAALDAEPRAVVALDPAALDLERDDPLVRVAEDEVGLVVVRTVSTVTDDHAGGMEDLPLLGKLGAERIEGLDFSLGLDVGRQGVREGDGHGGTA